MPTNEANGVTIAKTIADGANKININRIYHRSPMQIGKSQPKGKWIMPETRFTKFPALSVDPRVGFSRSASEVDV